MRDARLHAYAFPTWLIPLHALSIQRLQVPGPLCCLAHLCCLLMFVAGVVHTFSLSASFVSRIACVSRSLPLERERERGRVLTAPMAYDNKAGREREGTRYLACQTSSLAARMLAQLSRQPLPSIGQPASSSISIAITSIS